MASDTFQHAPLRFDTDEIRLVRFVDDLDDDNEIINCVVEHYKLNHDKTRPPFSAVSYTWGPPEPSVQIRMNGKPYNIRLNLFQFLQAFKSKGGRTRYLWIDQMCINQSSTQERNHQVGLMGEIYHKATEVIAWLGLSDAHSDTIAALAQKNPRIDYNKASCYTADQMSLDEYESAVQFFRRPYWSRLWIVQEVMLAGRVSFRCGSCTFEWVFFTTLRRMMYDIYSVPRVQGDLPAGVEQLLSAKVVNKTTRNRDFGEVIKFSSNDCEQPLDRVYGLQGLIREEEQLEVDYDKSPVEVFCDAAIVLISSPRQFPLSSLLVQLGKNMELKACQSQRGVQRLEQVIVKARDRRRRLEREVPEVDKAKWRASLLHVLQPSRPARKAVEASENATPDLGHLHIP